MIRGGYEKELTEVSCFFSDAASESSPQEDPSRSAGETRPLVIGGIIQPPTRFYDDQGNPTGIDDYTFVMASTYPGLAQLPARYDEALRRLKARGKIDRVLNKYGVPLD